MAFASVTWWPKSCSSTRTYNLTTRVSYPVARSPGGSATGASGGGDHGGASPFHFVSLTSAESRRKTKRAVKQRAEIKMDMSKYIGGRFSRLRTSRQMGRSG